MPRIMELTISNFNRFSETQESSESGVGAEKERVDRIRRKIAENEEILIEVRKKTDEAVAEYNKLYGEFAERFPEYVRS